MRSGSKETFYKWVDDVKKAYRHIGDLEEKKLYWERRLNKYNAVTFDRIGSGSSNKSVEDEVLYVLGKIESIKKKIKVEKKKIEEYKKFMKRLNHQEEQILFLIVVEEYSFAKIAIYMTLSKTRVYEILNTLAIKYQK